MIPSGFDYTAPESVEDAIGALAQGGEDAKLLAGGHSLIPLMKMRLATPTLLVDIRKLDGLRGIRRENGDYRIGALTTHAEIAAADLGLASEVAGKIADQQVRNRGTIGGSLAHADPAADLPGVLLALDGSVIAQGPNGTREIPARELFVDFLTTSIAEDEIVTEVRLPALEGYSWGTEKFTRRAEDWGMVGVCAVFKQGGSEGYEDVRVALTNMDSIPRRASGVETSLVGGGPDAIERAAERADEGTNPPGDLNATADYKRHLARVLTRRALITAAGD